MAAVAEVVLVAALRPSPLLEETVAVAVAPLLVELKAPLVVVAVLVAAVVAQAILVLLVIVMPALAVLVVAVVARMVVGHLGV